MSNEKHFTPHGSSILQQYAGYERNNNWADVNKIMRYLSQEYIEAIVALNARDIDGFRDAIADIRVLLDAIDAATTIDLEADYAEVINKLNTRFDKTPEDAKLTQLKYERNGVKTTIAYNEQFGIYTNIVCEDTNGLDNEFYPAGKWLKSYKFQQPIFQPLDKPFIDSLPDEQIREIRNNNFVLTISKVNG